MAAPGLVLPVPAPGDGVCGQCHGPAGAPRCFCCSVLLARLGSLAPVVPVGVCPVPGPFHTVLRGYKDAPALRQRDRYAEQLRSILCDFVGDHGGCVTGAGRTPLTRTVLVPAGPRRARPWPMVPVAEAAVGVGLPQVVPALEWSADAKAGASAAPTGHLVASSDAFTVGHSDRTGLRGRGVVLLDDSYTTGATAQSAAQALRRAGAAAVVVLVLARVVRPGRSTTQRAYWEQVQAGQRQRRRAGTPEGRPHPCAAGPRCRWVDSEAGRRAPGSGDPR